MKRPLDDLGTQASRQVHSARPGAAAPGADARLAFAVLHALLEQLPVGIVVVNGAGGDRVLYENELAQQIRMSDAAKAEWPMARALLLGEVVGEEEIDVVMPDGRRHFLSVSATPITTGSGTDGAVVTFMDVTDAKQAAAWRPIIESLQRL